MGIINVKNEFKFTLGYFVLNRLILWASVFLVLSNDIPISMRPFSDYISPWSCEMDSWIFLKKGLTFRTRVSPARVSTIALWERPNRFRFSLSTSSNICWETACWVRCKSPVAFGLKNMDLEARHKRVTTFMTQTKAGTGPTIEDLQELWEERFDPIFGE